MKTRLAIELGDGAALAAYRSLAERVIADVQTSEAFSPVVCFTPRESEQAMRIWLGPSARLRAQCDGGLGERMAGAIAEAVEHGADRVVVIGTDCPDVNASVVEHAFEQLDDADVVLGPATDGGYYLIGMSALHASLFAHIPWSTADTLRVTLDRARESRLSIALLEERNDIDTADDWRHWLAQQTS